MLECGAFAPVREHDIRASIDKWERATAKVSRQRSEEDSRFLTQQSARLRDTSRMGGISAGGLSSGCLA